MSSTVEESAVHRHVASAVTVGVMTVVAWLAIGAGLVLASFSLTGQADTAVPVRLSAAAPARSTAVVPCVDGWPTDGSSSCSPAASADEWPGGEPLPVLFRGGMVAGINEAPPLAALLSTTPAWSGLVAAGVVVLVLVPVLRSTASGRPFRPGNARRLAVAAGVVVAAWVLATAGPALAAPTIISLIEAAPRYTEHGPLGQYDMPAGWLVFDLRIVWWPLLPALLLAALAASTRSGTRLAADTEGLV